MEHAGSLEVLPAGSALQDPDELGFDRAVGRIIQRVRGRADIVLVDAPPVLRGHAIALSAPSRRGRRRRAPEDAEDVGARGAGLDARSLAGIEARFRSHRGRQERGSTVNSRDTSPRSGGRRPGLGRRSPSPHPQRTARVAGETAACEEIDGRGDEPTSAAPAQERSKPSRRPFGGLTPARRRCGARKAAKRRPHAQRPAPEETQDGVQDA